MPNVKPNTTIREYQQFVKEVYGLSNDRYFSLQDMLTNVERFMTRALKGIRKEDNEKTKLNLIISSSWFMSMLNQLHIDVEDFVWKRFPYKCSYCANCPCVCKAQKVKTRRKVSIDESKRPKTMEEFQEMFNKIYPPQSRTLDHAGVHLMEEMGEVSEAILIYRGNHKEEDFKELTLEATDLVSCMMGVFNSMNISMAEELSIMFKENCHICKKAPCVCTYDFVVNFKF